MVKLLFSSIGKADEKTGIKRLQNIGCSGKKNRGERIDQKSRRGVMVFLQPQKIITKRGVYGMAIPSSWCSFHFEGIDPATLTEIVQ